MLASTHVETQACSNLVHHVCTLWGRTRSTCNLDDGRDQTGFCHRMSPGSNTGITISCKILLLGRRNDTKCKVTMLFTEIQHAQNLLFKSFSHTYSWFCFPGGSTVKNPPANARDVGLIPGSGRSPGEGHDNPLQYSSLGNSMDGRAWHLIIHGVTKRKTQLSK